MADPDAKFDERDSDIVGMQVEKQTNIGNDKKEPLTLEQKVERELLYVTAAMGLEPDQVKHWRYRLFREYKEQEKIRKRLEKLEARKQFRKLMKKANIEKTLEQIEDYASFYGQDVEQEKKEKEQAKLDKGKEGYESGEDSELELIHQGVFDNRRDRDFYKNGEDMDFVRYHKRVSRNFHSELQEILDSSKQTVARGIKNNLNITINSVRLNKSSTVANVFWDLAIIDPEVYGSEVRMLQARAESEYIHEERTRRINAAQAVKDQE